MNKNLRTALASLLMLSLMCLPLTAMAETSQNEQADIAFQSQIPSTKVEYDGVMVVAGLESAFKVTSVISDDKNHEILLEDKAGKKGSLKLGPEVRNFHQIVAGDYVVVSENAQILVYVDKVGQVPGFGESIKVFTAPKGLKPGLIVEEQNYLTLPVTSVDASAKTLSITLPDNTIKTVKAPKLDFKKISIGSSVIVQLNREKSIMVVAPK